ncbi:TorF family putative porin [Brevundimonas sp.]|jgi:uncharacterized protein (TIGR02001 family)|uniref:TorF family putative porin n=1 Tax=Brevundimonas sp. TaxID=1871086 RepID=UPI0037BFDECE
MSVKMFAAAAALTIGMIASAAPAPASAEEPTFSANIGAVSDYVFRGFSQTNENPAIQGGVDMTYGSFYAGAWASNVDFGDDTNAEVDVYGGYRTEAAGYALDFGVIGYLYPGEPSGADYNYVEFKAAGSRAIGPATVGAAVYYSPDFFGVDESATYVELNGAFSPIEKLTVSGAVGQQFLDVGDDYATWNIGATYALDDTIGFDVRYHDTDVTGVPGASDRVVAGLKFAF